MAQNNLKYLKNNVNNARRKKVWLVEIMVCCGVICGADEKWCGVPFPLVRIMSSSINQCIYVSDVINLYKMIYAKVHAL